MSDNTTDPADTGRAFWRSRRGLQELDLLLVPFAEQAFDALEPAQRASYLALLDFEDMEVYAWISGRMAPPDEFEAIVSAVQTHHGLA